MKRAERALIQRIQPVRWLLVATVGTGLAEGAASVAQAAVFAHVVNGVFLAGDTKPDVVPWMMALLLIITVRAAASAGRQRLAGAFARRAKVALRDRLVQHLLALGPAYTRREQAGELAMTVTTGLDELETYLAKYLPQTALAVWIPLAILGFIAVQDRVSALVLAITGPLLVFFMILIGLTAERITRRQWDALGRMSAHFLDVLRGIVTLKVFGRSGRQSRVIAEIGEQHRKATMAALRVAFLSAFVLELFAMLSTAFVAVDLGIRLVSGRIPYEMAFTVLLLTPEFFQPIRLLGTQYHAGLSGLNAAARIFEILDTPIPGLADTAADDAGHGTGAGHGARSGTAMSGSGIRLELRQVFYRYPDSPRPALSGLTLTVRAGETVAIVGPSGSGKSTLLHLLLGFLRPDSGEILVNGQPLSRLPVAWWRRQVAYVPQHPHLFPGTILDNLRLADPGMAPERARQAVAAVDAEAFIQRLPEGERTVLGEDVPLSGGQIQRLAVARALAADRPLLLMDEPTAQLDLETEHALQQALDTLWGGRTAIVIAHRLSTAMRADRILVMDEGRVVQEGTHDTLMEADGLYRRLFSAYRGEVS
ncbi:thiol reductant ABC exporter subunit CydD [Alicyclobacillus macrosporangiidus]|uniref:thiol reductant ABC exporter subunit CydD n=1 Tax=Alicyclobacillus macrosporangiidus TaxID=392015 RepID=UPI0005566111|nr:thiol reductant ABC exporter subunit CydD [Alicyclobacillus macrosporangiidus]